MKNTDDKKFPITDVEYTCICCQIHAHTCKYMQIQPDLFGRICTYLHVFGVSICKYLCQYLQVLQVFASIQGAENC